jgi:hypothetical protein
MPLIPAGQRDRHISEFKVSLVNRVSSKIARVIQRKIFLKTTTNQKAKQNVKKQQKQTKKVSLSDGGRGVEDKSTLNTFFQY